MTNMEQVGLETVSEELLTCPFCGRKPDIAHDEHAADVFCPNEECIGVKSVSYAENIGDGTPLLHAIAAWNRRSPVLASRLAIQAPAWQGMESAPLNGKHCILAVPYPGGFIYSVQGAYQNGQWNVVDRNDVHPLYWMPNFLLPKPLPTSETLGATK